MIDLENLKPEVLWYVVGLIATDGNLSSDGRHIFIVSKDIDYLLSVKAALGLKTKIGRKVGGYSGEKKYGVIQIGDVNFYRYLLSVGLIPKKSLTLGKLNIPNEYFNDFLRGVIDGDGN